jgi:DNA replication and repair protein RecF
VELTSLTIRNFRNLASVDIEIPPSGVVIIGDNGQGKTNLLEAIYYLVLFRSLRGSRDRDLVRFGEAGFFIAGDANPRVTVGYETAGRRKKVTSDGSEVKKLAEVVGVVTAVALAPADRALVGGGPSGRRRYLDVLLSLSSDGYLKTLSEWRAIMRQRNAALKRGNKSEAQAFDGPLARVSHRIAAERNDWVSESRTRFAELSSAMGEHARPGISYYSRHWIPFEGPEGLERVLGAKIERDMRRGTTTVGPHRDDLILTLKGKDIRKFGSAGQQRTAAIALRMLEAQALERSHATQPIALFDDVFAELDQDRQERLLALIGEALPGQAIITAPRDAEVPAALFDRPRWNMRGGRIEQL